VEWIGWIFAVYVLIGAASINFHKTEKWINRMLVIILWLPLLFWELIVLKRSGYEWDWEWVPGKRKDQ